MAIAETPAIFLADFGVPCTAGAYAFVGIFDAPTETLDAAGVNLLSNMYLLTCRASDVAAAGITSGSAITVTVNGTPFTVRDVIYLDDATFVHLTLSR